MKTHIKDDRMSLQGASDECVFHRGARGYSVAYAKGGRLHLPVKQRFTAELITWVRIPPCAKSVSPAVWNCLIRDAKMTVHEEKSLCARTLLFENCYHSAKAEELRLSATAMQKSPCLKTDTVYL